MDTDEVQMVFIFRAVRLVRGIRVEVFQRDFYIAAEVVVMRSITEKILTRAARKGANAANGFFIFRAVRLVRGVRVEVCHFINFKEWMIERSVGMNGHGFSCTASQGVFTTMGFPLSQSRPTWCKGLFLKADFCYALDVIFPRGVK